MYSLDKLLSDKLSITTFPAESRPNRDEYRQNHQRVEHGPDLKSNAFLRRVVKQDGQELDPDHNGQYLQVIPHYLIHDLVSPFLIVEECIHNGPSSKFPRLKNSIHFLTNPGQEHIGHLRHPNVWATVAKA